MIKHSAVSTIYCKQLGQINPLPSFRHFVAFPEAEHSHLRFLLSSVQINRRECYRKICVTPGNLMGRKTDQQLSSELRHQI